jgi:hypothetical protein
MNWLVACVATLFLVACNTVPTEHELVGTWTMPTRLATDASGKMAPDTQQMVDLTLAPDHTFIWSPRGQAPTAYGYWHLDGRTLITEFTSHGKGYKIANPYRDRIVKVSSKEVIYVQGKEDAGVEVHLTRRCSERLPVPRPTFYYD